MRCGKRREGKGVKRGHNEANWKMPARRNRKRREEREENGREENTEKAERGRK